MKAKIISIFPEIFSGFLQTSLIQKAIEKQLVSVETIQLRDFAEPPHYHVDDTPYGGGAGMVLKPEPLAKAVESARKGMTSPTVILLSASGAPFTQEMARELSALPEIIFICGRYEGVDQRAIDLLVDQEISIGDYVLMGGEVAAMVVMEASIRLIEGVLGNPQSIEHESFSEISGGKSLEGPQYTRPASFEGLAVPEILLSGDHRKITRWREEQALKRTSEIRPGLLNSPKKAQS